MKLILDGNSIKDKESLHKHMEESLAFPEWYGGNLDALYDCLTELMEEVDVELLNWDAMKEHLGEYADRVRRVLNDAAQANLNILIIEETKE